MPLYLDAIDVVPEIAECKSVLIVPCRFCPAASSAVKSKEPYIEFFRRLLKTAPYERFIETTKSTLEDRGIKTSVFKSHLPNQLVLCMWTFRRREKLRRLASSRPLDSK